VQHDDPHIRHLNDAHGTCSSVNIGVWITHTKTWASRHPR